jgi:hypothetical protein
VETCKTEVKFFLDFLNILCYNVLRIEKGAEMAKRKSRTIFITAELEIDSFFGDIDETTLVGEWIKVKSGEYENAIMGIITSVSTENTEER